ncbi:alpha/beta hydrolase [Longispora sp. K20-0274]|uniref:alpha/beta hydrolase n=1 Tax=Longispora sp. K20-0274 TaxID=3088255 RepID=UPI00399AFE1F
MSDLTLPQLLALDPEALHTLPSGWGAVAGVLSEGATDYGHVARQVPQAWSDGPAASAANGKLLLLGEDLQAAHTAARVLSMALEDYAHGMTSLRRRALEVIYDAEDSGYGIDQTTGTITPPEAPTGPGARRPVIPVRSLLESFAAIITEARALDDTTARKITTVTPDEHGVLQRPPGTALLDRASVAAQRGRDPKAVNDWWRSLTPEQRGYAIAAYPELVGWLDGVPADARDQANRINLRTQHDLLVAERDALAAKLDRLNNLGRPLTPDERNELQRDNTTGRLAELNRKIGGLEAIGDRLDKPQPGQPPAYLLGVSPDGSGRAIVAVGNPDAAGNIATYVAGTFTYLDSEHIHDGLDRSDKMASDAAFLAPDTPTSVIMWFGYDAPQSIAPEAMQDGWADHAAGDLRRFEDGLRATHDGPRAHQTIIGHSYGTTAVGHAATSGYLNADDIVFVASPGVGADHASDLHFGDGGDPSAHVWATTAAHDVIGAAEGPGQILHDIGRAMGAPTSTDDVNNQHLINGRNPANPTFGGRIFTSAPGTGSGSDVHNAYWHDGSPARDNLGRIIVGKYGEVR